MRRTGSAHLPAEASVVEDPEDGSSILDLDDIPGPIMTPEFQTPVGFYKLRNQPNIIVIQGTALGHRDKKPITLRVPMARETAMQLLAALDAYREEEGLV